jgi:hypothetical protein
MNYNIISYGIYLLITIYVVVVVGGLIHKNGRPFLINVFHQNISLADSVNNLLLIGYYLFNIGYCIISLKIWKEIGSLQEVTETLSYKIGMIVFILGLMHLFNVLMLLITEKKYRKKDIQLINNNKNQ